MSNVGKIKQIIGSVLDITFENGQLPEIFNALEIDLVKNGVKEKVVAEVQQHLGDNTVRAIALSSTDGMIRGLAVTDTGASISVPVGEVTLGRNL
jgi:F-type H+-transporting ATPase subunit beta